MHRRDIAHPYLGLLDIYQWIKFFGDHEAMHLNHIDRILRALT